MAGLSGETVHHPQARSLFLIGEIPEI